MSNNIFPSVALKGITFSQFKTPTVSRRIQRSVSGRELAIPDYVNPIWNFRLPISFLRNYSVGTGEDVITSEMRLLLNFYNAMVLSGDTFLYLDKDDYSVTEEPLGIGDGVATAFQLIRFYYAGGFAEHIIAPTEITEITIDGTPTMDYTLDSDTGIVTFGTPPGMGLDVAATFTYYFRCRFSDDSLEFEKFGSNVWAVKEVRFRSVVL